jgi:hypothetical protein
MKIAIVYDDIHGISTYKILNKEFDTEYIKIDSPNVHFVDKIYLDCELVRKLSEFDVILTYIKQVDMSLEIAEEIKNKVTLILVGIWQGLGFKNQLTKYENIITLENAFNLNIDNIITLKNIVSTDKEEYRELLSKFKNPKIRINCQGEHIIEL